MPRSPDAAEGPLYEEKIIFEEQSSPPANPGELSYHDGSFEGVDDVGLFNLRDVQPHAVTHEDDGDDELTVQNLGSGAADGGLTFQSDGAGGVQLTEVVPGYPAAFATLYE